MACIYTAKYMLPGDAPLIVGGALLDLDGRIAETGPLAQLRRGNPTVRIVDFGDTVLLPPLVNAHTHLELTDFPRWAESDPGPRKAKGFVDWIEHVIRVKHAVPEENYPDSVRHGIELSLQAGTGAVGDILSQLPARKAYRDSPLCGRIYLETLGQDADYTSVALQKIEQALHDETIDSMELGVSPHSPYSLSREYLSQLFSRCSEAGLSCTTHIAESTAEVEFLLGRGGEIRDQLYPFVGWQQHMDNAPGQRPAAYLRSLGGLRPNNLLVHGVQLNQADIDQVAAAGCSVVLCPRSNDRLGVGTAPVRALRQAHVNLALGTDSLASCGSLSVWDEMAFAARWFAGQVDAPALVRMATSAGADALGLRGKIGRLEVGADSSFQVLNARSLPGTGEIYDFLTAPQRGEDLLQLYLSGSSMLPEGQ